MNKYKLRRVIAICALAIIGGSCAIGIAGANREVVETASVFTDTKYVTTYATDTTTTSTSCTSATESTTETTAYTTTECTTTTCTTYTTTTAYVPNTECVTIPIAQTIPVATLPPVTIATSEATKIEIQQTIPVEIVTTSESITETTTLVSAETTTETTAVKNPIIAITASEMKTLAALVTLEAGSEGYECQKAVASIVINRMLTSGSTLNGVVYAKGQFSVAGRISSTTPFEVSTKAVNDVVYNGTTLPIYVTYFRAGYYHTWGDQVAYCNLDNTYFSYSQALRNQYK